MDNLPNHIAIIMDGNRRWAKKRMLPQHAGHKAGANALETLSEAADALGLNYLTVYAFSTENWQRDQEEVTGLMNLMRDYLDKYFSEPKQRNMRLLIIGDRAALAQDLIEKIEKIEHATQNNTGLTLIIAINYGGRDEIVRATKKLLRQVIKTGHNIDDIDEAYFARHLDISSHSIPDPELLIRTSGELRLSNFLLWQLAYTELYITDTLWPDFTIEHMKQAISEYNKRIRKLGV